LAELLNTLEQVERALSIRHAEQELAYQQIIAKDEAEQQRSSERVELDARLKEIKGKRTTQERLVEELKNLQNVRTALVTQFSERRDKRHCIRGEIAATINGKLSPEIKVSVTQNSDKGVFKTAIEQLLRNAECSVKYGPVAQRITDEMTPLDFMEAIRDENEGELRRTGLNSDQARKLIACMKESKQLHEIDALDIPDMPKIELNIGEDGSPIYHESHALSTGQKCTSILPILLLDSDRPLLIDQPEDNLDNRFIFTNIVKKIETAKANRQLIFITHNPNIPVLGEAERVFVLCSDGKSGRKQKEGDVDECREEIIHLLEGGIDAFRMRGERYRIEGQVHGQG